MKPAKYLPVFLLALVTSCYNEDHMLERLAESGISVKDYIIAHRGDWNSDDSPQNSRASLKRALDLNIYGTEFDVRQIKDGVLVVNHDGIFNGLSITQSTYQELSQYTLSNGETIPRFEEFLEIKKRRHNFKGGDMIIVILQVL